MNALRRNVLKGAAGAGAVAVAVAAGLLKPTQALAAWNASAFEAKNVGRRDEGLGVPRRPTARTSPSRHRTSPRTAPSSRWKSPAASPAPPASPSSPRRTRTPLVGDFNLSGGAQGFVSTRIKMGSTSLVRAVVNAGGKSYGGQGSQGHHRRLRRLIAPCPRPASRTSYSGKESQMAEPMRIRATMAGDVADVKVLMNHPMETGLRKDAKTGQLVPRTSSPK
jgi:sulfur-oxidizing protein SoxY